MRDSQNGDMRPQRSPRSEMRWTATILSVIGVLGLSMFPGFVEGAPFDIGPIPSEPVINCSNPVMTRAPKFLASPAGAAKYPFTLRCTSPEVPGVVSVVIEGSWTPSETRRDRPNASESVTIKGYEPFLTERSPGGTIFMYWTGSCTADPWLQRGTCSRFGEYIPDDLREMFRKMVGRPFPLTGNSISSTLKQQLVTQYQAMNSPSSARSNVQQGQNKILQQSQIVTQAQHDRAMAVQPPAVMAKPKSSISDLTRSGIIRRGVESEQGTTTDVETSDQAMMEEGLQEESRYASLAIDRSVHVMNVKGEPVVLQSGMYEVTVAMDLLLALAREGQPTVMLPANQSSHNETMTRSLAAAISSGPDEIELIFMTSDGRRFDARGSRSGGTSRGTDIPTIVSGKALQDAVRSASVQPRSAWPACEPNSADIGPRWLPVPCTMPTSAPAP